MCTIVPLFIFDAILNLPLIFLILSFTVNKPKPDPFCLRKLFRLPTSKPLPLSFITNSKPFFFLSISMVINVACAYFMVLFIIY